MLASLLLDFCLYTKIRPFIFEEESGSIDINFESLFYLVTKKSTRRQPSAQLYVDKQEIKCLRKSPTVASASCPKLILKLDLS
jgi:hypothetical protein